MCVGIYVKYPFVLSDFNEAWIFSTDFEKPSNITFNENPSSVGWIVLCGQMEGRPAGQTSMSKLMVAVMRMRLQILQKKC